MPSSFVFIPLFPAAEQLSDSIDYINLHISQLERSIPDATYSYELAIDYLKENRFNANNYKSIRSELNVLFNWAWFVEGIAISEINRISLRKFIDFCNEPPLELIAPTAYPYVVIDKATGVMQPNPKWRPFINRGLGVYTRKLSTLKAQLSLLSSFFLFLEDLEYAEKNPAAVLLRRLNVNNTRVEVSIEGEKALSELQWQYVWESCQRLAAENREKHQRSVFLMALLYLIYPRISEISARPGYSPMMSSFKRHRSGTWYFHIPHSKGGKSRDVPCPPALIEELRCYRRHLDLSELPEPNENTPLFVRHQAATHGREAGILNAQLGSEAIREIIHFIFEHAAMRLQTHDAYAAQELRGFSAHSLRHTGITAELNAGTPLQVIMKNAGHADLSTLSIYASANLNERAQATLSRQLPS